MATYKQRIPIHRVAPGRHSPDYAKGPAAQGSSSQHANQAASQHQYFSAHQSFSSAYHNPADDILDNASDQEWTSVRRSTDTKSRAAYRQRMLEQRIQDWHLVLDQHRLNSSYQSDHSSAEDDKPDLLPPTSGGEGHVPVASAASRLAPVNTSITPTISQSLVTSPDAATQTSGSHFAFSDLASDSIGDESEDLGLWSPDDDDSVSTISRYRRQSLLAGVVPSSPTASQSSLASFGNLPHPSFYHGGPVNPASPALRFQSRMPFHDGSGNFVAYRRTPLQSRSHTGSELDSDHGGWESAVSSSKARSVSSSSRRIKRRVGQSVAARTLGPFSPGEFESMLQSIASLQAQQQQQVHEQQDVHQQSQTPRPYTFRPLARDGLALRPRWPRSSSVASSVGSEKSRNVQPQRHHQPMPRRPSAQMQKAFKSYDSDNEDLSQLVAKIPSNAGWLQAFEQTLESLNVKHASEQNLNEVSMLNPIMALVRHSTEEPSDLTGSGKTLVPEEALNHHHPRGEMDNEGLRSMNATPTPASTRRKAVAETASSTDTATPTVAQSSQGAPSVQEQVRLRTVQNHISASSMETLQRLQDRQRSSDYRRHSSFYHHSQQQQTRHRRRNSHGSVISEPRDPMQQIQFAPTLPREATSDEEAMTSHQHHARRLSKHGGQSWGEDSEDTSEHDATLFRAFISTLRKFRDHVKSNLLYPELDEHYLSSLRFENSDFGIEWATEGGTPPPRLVSHGAENGFSNTSGGCGRHSLSASMAAAGVKGPRPGLRRAGSDCALESLKHHGRRRAAHGQW